MTEPSFKKQFLSCGCGHEWADYLPINCRVEMWAAAVGTLRCPECDGEKIYFGQTPKELPVELGKDIPTRLYEWRNGADTGLSSETIVAVMSGAVNPPGRFGWEYPRDPGDLGRCLRLLRLIPEWRERISEMSKCGPVWDQLAAHWTELETSMSDEVGIFWEKGKSAPKTANLTRGYIEAGNAMEKA